MQYIIDFCKNKDLSRINLEVNSNNITAINLYRKFDFKEVGIRKRYYKDADAILFTLNI